MFVLWLLGYQGIQNQEPENQEKSVILADADAWQTPKGGGRRVSQETRNEKIERLVKEIVASYKEDTRLQQELISLMQEELDKKDTVALIFAWMFVGLLILNMIYLAIRTFSRPKPVVIMTENEAGIDPNQS